MKNGKRIAALALSLVVALGSVCYRPPKAEAVVFESAALVSALTSTYLSSTGFSFSASADNWDTDAVNERIYNETKQFFVDVYSAYVETEEEFYALLCDGAEILTNGAVKFSAAAANMLGRFEDWLIEKLGITAGGDAVGFVPSVMDGYMSFDGMVIPSLPVWDYAAYPYSFLFYSTQYGQYTFVALSVPLTYVDGKGLYNEGDVAGEYVMYYGKSSTSGFWSGPTKTFSIGAGSGWNDTNKVFLWANPSIYSSDGVLFLSPNNYDVVYDNENFALSVSIPSDYEAAPDIDEQYAMVVDTGLTFEDEQSYIDAVLGGVAAGTLSPTYTIEETTAGDVTVPGEDAEDDTQVGILNWVKKIWQSVKELPQTIADAVANVFVPSEEFMATVPETIADTFGSRTGFLTYPTSVLYDFVDMLSETSGDFILSWPTVREPSTGGVMMEAGQFNVSKFVRDNQSLSDWYIIYRYAVGAYLTFLFFGLCRRKYNSVVGDRLGV